MIPRVSKVFRSERGAFRAYYRPDSSDEYCLREVIDHHAYRRTRDHFDVEPDELWLDLGANIGAFAIYCALRGAVAHCYEPEPDCYQLLLANIPWSTSAGWRAYDEAVTSSSADTLTFYGANFAFRGARQGANFTRATVHPLKTHPELGTFKNVHGMEIMRRHPEYDGIKMDIEGSEMGLLDNFLLPYAEKLVLEYHTTRDQSMANFARRLEILRDHYEHVVYMKSIDTMIAKGGMQKSFADRLIHCWGRR